MTETFLLLRIRREACVWWWSWVGTDGVRRENVDARTFLAVGLGSDAHIIFVRGGRHHQKGGRALHGPRFARGSCIASVTWLRHQRRREQVATS
ncbi:unnamed protein product [Ectocarpus sp. CCAP 1310/34]|nr:unnamed protein product [Ectocarpus sp. CCAP 1310/34]